MKKHHEDGGQHLPWLDGLSTKPEVDELLKHYPPETIEPGKFEVSDAELMAIIKPSSPTRYRTVCDAWIRRLKRDHRVILYRVKTTGFYCPPAAHVFARTHGAIRHAGRSIGSQLRHVAIAKPENEQEKITQDHQGRLLHAQKRDLRKARMNILPPTASPEQPKIGPPEKRIGNR